MLFRSLLLASCAFLCSAIPAQTSQPVSLSEALNRTEAHIALTKGSPFHAEMSIAGGENQPEYRSSIVVNWLSPTRNRVEVTAPNFHQVRIVEGTAVQEQTDGNFYPGWLHGFVTALLDPLAVKRLLLAPDAQLGGSRTTGGTVSRACVNRNDKHNGITDDFTWSGACVGSDGLLQNTYDFTTWMDFSDYKSFHQLQVARTYESFTGSYYKVIGKVTKLRDLSPAEADVIHVTQATPKDMQMTSTFISVGAQEARRESAKPFEWPPVREGKTEGYMIVHAVTDVTGQVRETSKHNSDNPGLEEAGRQAALGYKFKPMLVDGVPAQMEMPLVLQFKTTQGVPLPFLKGDDVATVSKTCRSPVLLPKGVGEPGRHYHVKVSVNEDGKRTGETFPDGYPEGGIVGRTVESCNFGVYSIDGKPTYYHVELEFIAP